MSEILENINELIYEEDIINDIIKIQIRFERLFTSLITDLNSITRIFFEEGKYLHVITNDIYLLPSTIIESFKRVLHIRNIVCARFAFSDKTAKVTCAVNANFGAVLLRAFYSFKHLKDLFIEHDIDIKAKTLDELINKISKENIYENSYLRQMLHFSKLINARLQAIDDEIKANPEIKLNFNVTTSIDSIVYNFFYSPIPELNTQYKVGLPTRIFRGFMFLTVFASFILAKTMFSNALHNE